MDMIIDATNPIALPFRVEGVRRKAQTIVIAACQLLAVPPVDREIWYNTLRLKAVARRYILTTTAAAVIER